MPTVKSKKDKVSRKVKLALAHKRSVAKENRLFEKMTPAEKRVTIAKDVLAQIELKKFIPTSGTWLGDEYGDDDIISVDDFQKNRELRDIINKTEVCTGCALGGLFMCTVKRVDDLKVSQLEGTKEAMRNFKKYGGRIEDHYDGDTVVSMQDIFKYMKRFFSRKQLKLIELAFEDGEGGTSSDGSLEEELAKDFFDNDGNSIENETDRLRLIMENLIVNNGIFDPNKKPLRVISYRTAGYNLAA